MHKKNVEVYHQGWLVKSPPDRRGIFRLRWHKRWFTLKQGELPDQFFLEYYTQQNSRKPKGCIDLYKVEQVDCGLSYSGRQSIKLQHVFGMKTPERMYYMAAETDQEMRDWVDMICQVCKLQEMTDKSDSSSVQYHNIGPNEDFEAKEIPPEDQTSNESTVLANVSLDASGLSNRFDQLSILNEYENDTAASYRQSEYSNRSTMMVGETQNNNQEAGLNYTNLPPMITSLTQSTTKFTGRPTGAIKKIPENLKLRSDDKINNNNTEEISSYRASGPYIPLSDCYSGSPVLLFKNENDPKTPLNSLDPKFYDTPRSHITNIGLNLTDDQPNSPKRNNTSNTPLQVPAQSAPKYSVNSSPTDSDGVSTDDEWTEPKLGDRKTRPSDSSMENETVAITAGQSYMKVAGNPIPLPPKRMSLVMEKKQETSDTEENASPQMIGPKDSSCCVDERYDFPRSYNVQGFTGSHMNIGSMGLTPSIHGHGHLMTSTPNLIHSGASTLDRSNMNFYANAAPRENNIFRFDFANTAPPPDVNRTLKPRRELNGYGLTRNAQPAPTVDRKLKPGTAAKPQLAVGTNSLKRRGPGSLSLSEVNDSNFLDDSLVSNQSFGSSPKTPNKDDVRLQYLDIGHPTSPPKPGLGLASSTSVASNLTSLETSMYGSIKEGPGVAYTTVDFLKTDAFNRVREDSEMTRASKSRTKN